MHSPSLMARRAASHASAVSAGSSPVQSKRRYPSSTAASAASLGSGSPGTPVVVTGQSCQNRLPAAVEATRSLATDRGHKAWSAGQVEMIADAGESAVLNQHLLRGLSLHVSMLHAEQPGRSQQPRCLSRHDLDRIEAVITGEQSERWIVIAYLRDDGFKGLQRDIRRVGDHQIDLGVEVGQGTDHVPDVQLNGRVGKIARGIDGRFFR